MPADWVRSIRDQCIDADVAFHFKQWGGKNKKKTGRILDGRTWDEWPNTTKRATRSKKATPTRNAV
jgi:protein gp37